LSTFKPKLATIKVTHQDDTRLVIDYHPIAYFLAGAGMAFLCYWAGIRYIGQDIKLGLIAFGAGTLFFAGFCLLFYRRVTVTFDKSTGKINQAKRVMLIKNTSQTFPLADFTGAAVQTSFSSDTTMQRVILQFTNRDAVPLITASISGESPSKAAEVINTWAGTQGQYE